MPDEIEITGVFKLGNRLAIELDGGETDLLLFRADRVGPPESVPTIEGDWRRIWP